MMSDTVTLAIVGGVVTTVGSIVAGFFAIWTLKINKTLIETKETVVKVSDEVKVNTQAIEVVAVAANAHEELNAFNEETALARKEAEDKLKRLQGQ
jgi:hypothetical protein